MADCIFYSLMNNISSFKDVPKIILTFILVLIPWTFFRAQDADQAFYILNKIATSFSIYEIDMFYPKRIAIVVGLVIFEWFQRRREYPLCIDFLPKWLRYVIYYIIIILIFFFGSFNYSPFIYFQF